MNLAFAYIYDEFVAEPRYQRTMDAMETELARCGIEGRIARLSVFRSPQKIVQELVNTGAKNIIFVGNDRTVLRMMSFITSIDATFGYIPISAPHDLADVFGIPVGEKSVEVVAARLVDTIDIGKVSDRFFLTEVAIPSTTAAVEVDQKYRLSPSDGGAIGVRNLAIAKGEGVAVSNAKDGLLEIVIQSKVKPVNASVFSRAEWVETRLFLKEGSIISKDPIHAFIDGEAVSGTSFHFTIVPNALRFITGRERKIPGSERRTLPGA